MKNQVILIITILLTFSIGRVYSQAHLEHNQWTDLLAKHVDDEGHVNYKGFVQDSLELNQYLAALSANHPTSDWKKEDQLAFWINAYNAFTVQLIVRNYPVRSIKELGGNIYKVNTPWDIKFIKIGDQTYDLNNIEHGIIRKEFDEGRIHFAVNCASVSCPPLRNEAYVGSRLNEQLDDQAKVFINDATKNEITKDKVCVSKIFKWFEGDITSGRVTVSEFINRYSETPVKKKTKLTYMDYEWGLNE